MAPDVERASFDQLHFFPICAPPFTTRDATATDENDANHDGKVCVLYGSDNEVITVVDNHASRHGKGPDGEVGPP